MGTNYGAITNGSSSSFLLLIFFFMMLGLSHQQNYSISPNGVLRNNETLVSAGRVFELGFFGVPSSNNRYLGIWFMDDPQKIPVWVANRDDPLADSTCFLQLRSDGNLILEDRRRTPIIINSGALSKSPNATATLLDTGNFVLQAGTNLMWQSFDYPTDTFLPGMKIGWFGLTSEVPMPRFLSSWESSTDPGHGDFDLGVLNYKVTNLSVYRGDSAYVDIGYWDGKSIHLVFANSSNSFNFTYVSNVDEDYYIFTTIGNYTMSWLVIASTGYIDEYTLSNQRISMSSHSLCQDSGNYEVNANFCSTPSPSSCNGTFSAINGSFQNSSVLTGSIDMIFSDCESICATNCSCLAYVPATNQTGCQIYIGSNTDVYSIIQQGGGLVYVRDRARTKHGENEKMLWLILGVSLVTLAQVTLIVVPLLCSIHRKNQNSTVNQAKSQVEVDQVTVLDICTSTASSSMNSETAAAKLELSGEKDQELPMISFSTIEKATDYFAMSNILGQGGFGPVYKGILPQGQEIAVKRLSTRSGQGIMEFRNEISLISKLQHRNLVRLLGCCIHGAENILVYEYMPNKSLDSFIFDSTKRKLLDWPGRTKIIEGIAQGLLYLHKYSRVRIIHRDLKTSNILLDNDMTPKISDFGMARIFEDNENQAVTKRIVGTYGYMSPEYAMDGLFSEKSDVFSFGIIVLEIITGKRNVAFFDADDDSLLSYVWKLWKGGEKVEFMDSTLGNSCSSSEVFKYIQVGLLCVQERAEDRPSMLDVASMLSNETMALPYPKEPGLLSYGSSTTEVDSSKIRQGQCSQNVQSVISVITPR